MSDNNSDPAQFDSDNEEDLQDDQLSEEPSEHISSPEMSVEGDEQESDSDDSDDSNMEIIEEANKQIKKPNEERITPAFLTKYEKARIIGVRAQQISKNSPIYVTIGHDDYDPISIAEKEFRENKIPFIIRRYLPNKTFEDWSLSELKFLG